VAVWLSDNIVGHISEVTVRRAGLVLRWVTLVYGNLLLFSTGLFRRMLVVKVMQTCVGMYHVRNIDQVFCGAPYRICFSKTALCGSLDTTFLEV